MSLLFGDLGGERYRDGEGGPVSSEGTLNILCGLLPSEWCDPTDDSSDVLRVNEIGEDRLLVLGISRVNWDSMPPV